MPQSRRGLASKCLKNLEPPTLKCLLLVMCLFLASLYSWMEEWKKRRSTNWHIVGLLRGWIDAWLPPLYQTQHFSHRTNAGEFLPETANPICLCCLLRVFFSSNPAHYLLTHIFPFICCIFCSHLLLNSTSYCYYCFISQTPQQ